MNRYFRLYGHFLRFSFSRAMAFRVDFLFRIVMDVIYYGVNLAFFAVIYRHTSLLGGWTLDETWIFVCAFLWADAFYMTVFSTNFWWLPVAINRGDLDYHLMRPVSSLFLLTLREFAANSFLNLVIATGLVWWSLARYPGPLGVDRVVPFFLLLVAGSIMFALLRVLFIVPIFWMHNGRGLDDVTWSLSSLAHRPHQIYHPAVRAILLSVLPLAFIASVPAHVLLEGLSWQGVLHVVAVGTGLSLAVAWAWRRGLRAYASASS